MSWRRGTVLRAALACAGTAFAAAALPARDKGGDPPTVRGPLALNGQRCFQKGGRFVCAFDYLLDRSATDDPADAWHAYWASSARLPLDADAHVLSGLDLLNGTRCAPDEGSRRRSACPTVQGRTLSQASGHILTEP